MLTDIVCHIFRMARPTNFKLGIRMEDDAPHAENYRTVQQRQLEEWRKLVHSIVLAAGGVAVSLLVLGLTVDIMSTFCDGFLVQFYHVWALHRRGGRHNHRQ